MLSSGSAKAVDLQLVISFTHSINRDDSQIFLYLVAESAIKTYQ